MFGVSKAISFVCFLWFIFFINHLVFFFDFNQLGMTPRTLTGLLGIFTMPFLHADVWHLIWNSIPLIVLLCFLYWTYQEDHVDEVVLKIIIAAGVLLWIFGRSYMPAVKENYVVAEHINHIGASGLVYGLFAYCLFSSIRYEKHALCATTILLFAMNYGSILSGMLPGQSMLISWDGHLMGAIGGTIVALTDPRKTA